MPGGVNSPVRAFRAVGGEPLFISKASGPRVTDADGLRAALKLAIAANSPALVEVVTDIDNEPLPFAFLARGRA